VRSLTMVFSLFRPLCRALHHPSARSARRGPRPTHPSARSARRGPRLRGSPSYSSTTPTLRSGLDCVALRALSNVNLACLKAVGSLVGDPPPGSARLLSGRRDDATILCCRGNTLNQHGCTNMLGVPLSPSHSLRLGSE
jgi:hypothetical protein